MRTASISTFIYAAAALLSCAQWIGAQTPAGTVKITPISDLRPDWLNLGVESPNGRFFVLRSYAGDSMVRYDRVTKQWAPAPGVTLGTQVRWSPDGRFLAYARNINQLQKRTVLILPMDTATGMPRGSERRINTRPAAWPAWSPDSRRIAYSVQDSGRFRIVIAPFNGGDETIVYDAPGAGGELAWSPDGKFIFAGGGALWPTARWLRVNVETRRADTVTVGPARMLGYSADGKYVAHYWGNELAITSATTGQRVQRLALPPRVVPTGWSRTVPGGITAIEHVVPANLQRISLADGRIHPLMPAGEAALGEVEYSPDGAQIAFPRAVDGVRQLHVSNADGSNLHTVGRRGDIGMFKWSPSGKQIAYVTSPTIVPGVAGGGIHLLDVASGMDREIVRSKDGIGAPAQAPGSGLGWRSDGQAVRYIWRPRGYSVPDREAREVTLAGADRLLGRPPSTTSAPSYPFFINDTLLVLREGDGIIAVNLRTGASKPLYKGSIRAASELGISPDGAWLVFAADRNDNMYPQMVSLKTGELRSVPYSLKGELGTIFFTPDGRSLLTSACISCISPNYVEKWDVVLVPINGDPPRVLTSSQSTFKDFGIPRMSPDGRWVTVEAEHSYNTRIVTLTFPKP